MDHRPETMDRLRRSGRQQCRSPGARRSAWKRSQGATRITPIASDGFGQGTPWWDDMIEAGVLAAAFLVAAILILLAGRYRSRVA
jgi:hypothetical protein